jgi:hypothetical protein
VRLRSLTGGPCLSAPTRAPLPFLPLTVRWGRPVDALARYALARLCCYPVGPARQSLPLLLACVDRAHARRDRRAHVATQLQTGTLTPSTSSRTPHFPPASLISPLPTHPSCARRFFKPAGASPSPGPLRPNSSPVELDRRPRSCSATVMPSPVLIPAPPEVNFPAGLSLLSPPFPLFCQLVAGDRQFWSRAVEPSPPGQPQPLRALFARAESPAPAMALALCALPR